MVFCGRICFWFLPYYFTVVSVVSSRPHNLFFFLIFKPSFFYEFVCVYVCVVVVVVLHWMISFIDSCLKQDGDIKAHLGEGED